MKNNALGKWSFKRAVTIRTYRDYHPIPVPLNLLSQFFLVLPRRSHSLYSTRNHATIQRKVSHYFVLLNLVDKTVLKLYFVLVGAAII